MVIIMNIEKFFDRCTEIGSFNEDCLELLNKVMSITSPMKFDDDFASDDEMDQLEAELDKFNVRSEETQLFHTIINSAKARRSSRFVFI